ncbi:hypothetical protein GALMADRAFT_144520 [Galerina marginata CBS 339.88]|uniref:Uncharacterized protein n=1 Tax=Galerina marginata (strain CBS 339.88) TaxID=685588 RepID=A0A067SKR0_GALM3|nr:hypothetical protein GALMADRAFT_144520 [Galerina marginata CBS 339.88]
MHSDDLLRVFQLNTVEDLDADLVSDDELPDLESVGDEEHLAAFEADSFAQPNLRVNVSFDAWSSGNADAWFAIVMHVLE